MNAADAGAIATVVLGLLCLRRRRRVETAEEQLERKSL